MFPSVHSTKVITRGLLFHSWSFTKQSLFLICCGFPFNHALEYHKQYVFISFLYIFFDLAMHSSKLLAYFPFCSLGACAKYVISND